MASSEQKARWEREAYLQVLHSLFHAARIAAMTYSSTEVARWGLLRKILPEPYNRQFREFIDVLHINYFYGRYPKENVEEEFSKWYREVKRFVENLELKTKKKDK